MTSTSKIEWLALWLFQSQNEAWAAGGSGVLLKTTNGGKSWVRDKAADNIPGNLYSVKYAFLQLWSAGDIIICSWFQFVSWLSWISCKSLSSFLVWTGTLKFTMCVVLQVHRRQPRVHTGERRRLAPIRWLKSLRLSKSLFVCKLIHIGTRVTCAKECKSSLSVTWLIMVVSNNQRQYYLITFVYLNLNLTLYLLWMKLVKWKLIVVVSNIQR